MCVTEKNGTDEPSCRAGKVHRHMDMVGEERGDELEGLGLTYTHYRV